jgi:sec-independent protein translocase protein TatA
VKDTLPNEINQRKLPGMGSFGTTEILIILLLLAVIFGARKLPDLGRGIGEGIRNFRKSLKDDTDSDPDKDKK